MRKILPVIMVIFLPYSVVHADRFQSVQLRPSEVILKNGRIFFWASGATEAFGDERLNFIQKEKIKEEDGSWHLTGLIGDFLIDEKGYLFIKYVEIYISKKGIHNLKKSELLPVLEIKWNFDEESGAKTP